MTKFSKGKIKIKKVGAVMFLLFLLPIFVLAAGQRDVVISEIAWMGTDNSASDEWIRIYNNTDKDIDLIGWVLEAEDGSPIINLDGNISAANFYLIERTDDDSLPDFLANQIYTGALGNNGEYLILKDSEGKIIDEIDCREGWLAGDKNEYFTMERIDVLASGNDVNNWRSKGEESDEDSISVIPASEPEPHEDDISNQVQNDISPIKSIAGENIEVFVDQEILFDASFSEGLTGEAKFFWNFGDGHTSNEKEIYHKYLYEGEYIAALKITLDNFSDTSYRAVKVIENNIVISEFLPNIKGADDKEWIELYNKSSQMIDISGWQIDDAEGGSSPFMLPENTFISAGGYLVFGKEATKISLNNGKDSVRIFTPDGILADEIIYEETYEDQSLNRTSSRSAIWSAVLTPGKKNIVIEGADKKISVLNLSSASVLMKGKEIVKKQPPNIIKSLKEHPFDNFVIFNTAQAAENSLGLQDVNVYEQFSADSSAIPASLSVIPAFRQAQDNLAGIQSSESHSELAKNPVVQSQYSRDPSLPQDDIKGSTKNKSTLTIAFCVGALGAFAIGYIDKKIGK